MMALRFGSYTADEAARELRMLRAENEATARQLALMTSIDRRRARERALRVAPLDLAMDVRADFARAERLATQQAREAAPVVRLSRAGRAPRRAARRVDGDGAAEGDPASNLRAVVEVFRILNQWHEERAR